MMRKSKGKQKLEMVKIPNESNLQVTFSKRRSGLFKKASELCTLCGVEVAIVVFSPKNKVFSFGHPSVEYVVDRFISRNPPQISRTMQLIEYNRDANICELNMQLTQVLNELEVETKRGEQLTQMRKPSERQYWWEAPIDELSPLQLAELKVSFEKLREKVAQQAKNIMIQSSTVISYFPGSSSTGRSLQFDLNNTTFNPSTMNMMPSASAPHLPLQPHQPEDPLHFSFPPH